MGYQTEFPAKVNVPGAIVELVRDKVLTDESWGNDVCPKFEAVLIGRTNDEHNTVVQLWCDYEDPNDREFGPDIKRFRVLVLENEQEPEATADFVIETDDVYEAIRVTLEQVKLYANGENVDTKAVGARFVEILEAEFNAEQLTQIAIQNGLDGACDVRQHLHEAFTSCQPAYYLKANVDRANAYYDEAYRHAKALLTLKYHPDTRHTAENPQGKCQFDNNMRCIVCGLGFPGYHEHTKDEDCALNAFGSCDVCGVFHGQPCDTCGGRGFHKSGCAESDEDTRVYGDGHVCGDECRSNGCTEDHK